MMKKIAVAALLSTVVAAPAFAADMGFYVMGAVGQARTSFQSEMDAALIGAGATGVVSSGKDNATAYKLAAGYQFNANGAVELSYLDSGKFSYTATVATPAGFGTATGKATGWSLVAVGILPIDSQFGVLGKLGVADIRSSVSAIGAGGFAAASGSKTRATYGLGVKYDLTNAVFLRGDWDSYKSALNKRVSVWSVGVGYKF